ncbi:hypothetical protein BJF79_25850 [Actinomadura sp. CNU-125]|uniref:DUF397 domain-containing protein n=1 Tax=Actinomadura sp. CNU-125 TaxID=1904961 RepID=UPI00096248F0|nr:DUF397 domain-containing protein [Actinomadura sp. CNU-125]OLT10580.1 hypothetical protein BJF79_25850 [Actinomadura sp. CNU-125]
MSTPYDLSHAQWRKSNRSGGNGNCVEVADLAVNIGVRDSKAPDAGHLAFRPDAWAAFLLAARDGRFDLP